ncbi:MAG TPA: single-stranded DNA-binding protein [Bryobacteraceae bacterium]|nr:single-stranded DNA-binding protein [Bryobacteraceae bacterium]
MASRSVNKVILIGHIGKDAETKFTQSGTSVTNITLATNRRWKDQQSGEWKDETDWHRVVYWRSENIANYLLKGKQIYVEGRLQTRNYDDKEGRKVYVTEVVADDIILLGGGREGAGAGEFNQQAQPVSMPRSARGPQQMPSQAPDPGMNQAISDDDVPF